MSRHPASLLVSTFPVRLAPVLLLFYFALGIVCCRSSAADLEIATFEVDVSPPVGSPLAYDPTKEVTTPLSFKGLILFPEDQAPIVLGSMDWLGVANQAQDEFRAALAEAVQTSPMRVTVHAIHQHDAPRCDLSAAEVLARYSMAEQHYDVSFIRTCIKRCALAAHEALDSRVKISSISFGKTQVQDVASNRRMLGPDGKVHTTRYTACRDPKIRALPLGVVDPWLRTLIFSEGDKPRAAITFYATHPQSYYRTGQANPDFPGIARNARQHDTGVFHLHFNGAGGNIGAGKFNDGTPANRQVLAEKVASAMELSWKTAQSIPVSEIAWRSVSVPIHLAPHLDHDRLVASLSDSSLQPAVLLNTAKKLALLERVEQGKKIDIHCLRLGSSAVLFMPGELFVEYQLAAQAMLPEANVMMAAYGEYGTGYIGTRIAYPQGGYEVSERASNVAADYEAVLVGAMRELLGVPHSRVLASDFTDTSGPLP